jgi:thiamine-phosphate diphosphorylase
MSAEGSSFEPSSLRARSQPSATGRNRPTLCLVTDRRRLSPRARTTRDELVALEATLDEAAAAGIDVIQVRERDLEAADLEAFVARVVRRTRGTATRVVVNERADVARAAGADGVHVRSDGPPVARIRAWGPPVWWVGRSIHSAAEGERHQSADYLLFGTTFVSTSKPVGAPVAGLAALREAVRVSATPIWAIGGVTLSTAPDCIEAGAKGVAAIAAFLDPGDGTTPGAVGARIEAMRRAVARDFGKLVE